MPTARNLTLEDDLSKSEADDISRAIHRILRKAKHDIRQQNTLEESKKFVRASTENLNELLDQFVEDHTEANFDDYWSLVQTHWDEVREAVNPLVGFYYSKGLLPNEVTESALAVYVLLKTEEAGLVAL